MDRLDSIAARAAHHSDIEPELLRIFIGLCEEAHRSKPDRPSLEIGTRAGGSAVAFLDTLSLVYGYGQEPILFTVDPYGNKPYPTGNDQTSYSYGNDVLLEAKMALALHPNHAHFLMRGEDFVERVCGTSYWWGGQEHLIGDFGFVFLDGDHSKETVLRTLNGLRHWSSGIVVIDNINWQPDLREAVVALAETAWSGGERWAALRLKKL